MYHVLDLLRWSPPEDKAMAGVLKAGFDGRIVQSQENGIYADTRKVIMKDFGLLLGVPCSSM